MKLDEIKVIRESLLTKVVKLSNKADILKDAQYKSLFEELKIIPKDQKAHFGKELNSLKNELSSIIQRENNLEKENNQPIDVSAPFDDNQNEDSIKLLDQRFGSIHPVSTEIKIITDIFSSIGFKVIESLEIDDDFHMFESLNFATDHPARDDFDTFITVQKDQTNKPYVAPAHTSTMQTRVLSQNRDNLVKNNQDIGYIIPGRVFRNEDVDARHEHTFYQIEGVYLSKKVTVANLLSVLRDFMSSYFNEEIKIKTQPVYFPFTEPSFEFSVNCIYCAQKGCHICSYTGWIEMLGCGMIHPNVLSIAGIDPSKYNGFAFGLGILRFIMIKYGIEDIRHYHSVRLEFLRQFK